VRQLAGGAKLLLESGLPGEVYFVTDDENCCFKYKLGVGISLLE